MDKIKFKVARIILFSLIFSIFCSCNQPEKTYYDTGELYSEKSFIKEHPEFSSYRAYYKNGALKEECLLYNTNSKRDPIPYDCIYLEDITKSIMGNWIYGKWISYYEDGEIKEDAYYHNGELVIFTENEQFPKLKERNIHLKFDGMKSDVKSERFSTTIEKSSDTIPFRLYVENTPQTLYSTTCLSNHNASVHESKNDNFSHELYIPHIPDTICLILQFMNEKGAILTSDSTSRRTYTIIIKN